MKAAGVNPIDTYIRSGNLTVHQTLPYTPGMDAAGVIKDVGKNVTKFKVDFFVVNLQNILCRKYHIVQSNMNISIMVTVI